MPSYRVLRGVHQIGTVVENVAPSEKPLHLPKSDWS